MKKNIWLLSAGVLSAGLSTATPRSAQAGDYVQTSPGQETTAI